MSLWRGGGGQTNKSKKLVNMSNTELGFAKVLSVYIYIYNFELLR